ncbi:RHO protein GDP dissociation inhibitor [Trichuris suis]|nr:RHO protein GDP dissociation inhibitor [Trichuris suis]
MEDSDLVVTQDNHPPHDDSYRAPAQKSVKEILEIDRDDPSLQKYKEALLGKNVDSVIVDPCNPKNVIVRHLALIVNGRDDVVMQLNGRTERKLTCNICCFGLVDLAGVEDEPFVIKEDCQYQLEICFNVQREIVAGMKYVQKVYRLGVQVSKDEYMVGSYPPRNEAYLFRTPTEVAPSGIVHVNAFAVNHIY